jgi:uncharacterized GH25 family protein
MKPTAALLAVLAILALAPYSALAHDLWATAENPVAGQPLKAVIGYGHDFPNAEDIPAEELPFFKVSAVGPKGPIALAAGAPNYVFTSAGPAEAGGHLIVADVEPIFWTRTPAGWSMKPKNESEGGTACGLYIEGAKGVVNIGAAIDDAVVTKPAGLPIEIVPLANPASIKPGEKLVLQVLLLGKPVAGVKVDARYGAFAALASPSALAFSDHTDQEGKVGFVPLAAGDWLVTARSEEPFEDKARCDKTDYGTSLYFTVK